MTPIIITLSLLIHSQLGRKNSGTDLGTGYGGMVCGFHTRPRSSVKCNISSLLTNLNDASMKNRAFHNHSLIVLI